MHIFVREENRADLRKNIRGTWNGQIYLLNKSFLVALKYKLQRKCNSLWKILRTLENYNIQQLIKCETSKCKHNLFNLFCSFCRSFTTNPEWSSQGKHTRRLILNILYLV